MRALLCIRFENQKEPLVLPPEPEREEDEPLSLGLAVRVTVR